MAFRTQVGGAERVGPPFRLAARPALSAIWACSPTRRFILVFAMCIGVLWGGPVGADEEDKVDNDRATAVFGRGDYAEALVGFRILAEKRIAYAQWGLGYVCAKGEGVPRDYAEATKWHRKCAEQEDAIAQLNLGDIYEIGQGIPQDYVLAHMWLNLAAAQGIEFAGEFRDLLAKKMTPAQVAKGQRLAREWKPPN